MEEYFKNIRELLINYPILHHCIVLAVLVLVALTAHQFSRYVLIRWMNRVIQHLPDGHNKDRVLKLGVISRLSNIIPALILISGVSLPIFTLNETFQIVIRNIGSAFIVLVIARAVGKLLDLIDILYRRRADAQNKPIKGFLQLMKILLFLLSSILIISMLVNRNPLILLSGLGAMAAVVLLIFQDTILSLVASLQLGSNDMVRIGDWIEMPSQNADGDVVEIALHTVKVQNWDKTITTLPVRKLITDSFINWRGMFDVGGRRIMRSLYLDQRSVRFLKDDEIKRLDDFVLLNEYLERKRVELAEWNEKLIAQGAKAINQRRVTNLGTFRAYVEHYLRSLPGINEKMILMVRQLQPGTTGIPLQIYCFTNDTRWIVYEGIQSDIFDHLLAILPVFDLRVFQQCSDTSGMVITTPALLQQEKSPAQKP
ncbi:MAG: mechanosensitive ion channel family protein [Lentisphaeria bacterium]